VSLGDVPERKDGKMKDFSANYLMIKAMDTHKTPAEIISEMVHERIAATV
jgi:hypothetical protein